MILKDLRVGRVIKLHEGDDPGGLLGLALSDALPHTNAGKMSCRVVVSTGNVDRSNDVVVTKGIDLADHRRLPVVLLNHNRDYPVGYAEDPMGHYTVRLDGDNRLVAETYFSKSTKIGEQAFRLVETGVLRGASIGFLPVPGSVEKSHAGGRLFKAARLCEYSHLVLPDNPEAVVLAVEKGFDRKPLCPELLNILSPLVPERAPVVPSGWEKKSMSQYDLDDTMCGGPGGDSMAPPPETGGGQDGGPDPNAAAPPDAAAGHSDHKSVVDDALGSVGASLWQEYCNGTISADKAGEMFGEAIKAHAKLKNPAGDDDGDGIENILDDDPEGDSDRPDLSGDDAEDDDDSDADRPDLTDKTKEKAEKAVREVYHKHCARVMTGVADDLAYMLGFDHLDTETTKAYVRGVIKRMSRLPSGEAMVSKALSYIVTKAVPAAEADADDVDYGSVLPLIDQLTNRIETITG